MKSTSVKCRMSWGALASLLLLTACGGGGGGSTGGTAGSVVPPTVSAVGPTVSRGVITARSGAAPASVTVNGIEYATTAATTVLVDGLAGSLSDLTLGRVAKVKGTTNDLTRKGSAAQIELRDALQGPIDGIDANARTITVMGQTVHIEDNLTHLGDDTPKTFADAAYNSGDLVDVHGYADSVNGLRATRVDKIAALTTGDPRVKGFISSLADISFSLVPTLDFSGNGFQVNFLSGTVPPVLPAAAVNGSLVEVAAINNPPFSNSLTASTITLEAPIGAPGDKVELEGYVANGVLADFRLDGQEVITDGATLYEGGPGSDFAIGLLLQAEGTLDAAGAITATRIRFAAQYKLEGDLTDFGLTVLGLPVSLTPFTQVDSGIDLLLNRHVQVSAVLDRNGALMATRVDALPPSTRASFQGPVSSADAAAGTLTIFGRSFASNGASTWRAGSGFALPATTKADFFAQLVPNATLVKVSWNTFGALTAAVDEAEIELGN